MRDLGRAQHASSEQLSALLDNRAEPDEQAFLAEHVDACVVCANELADLRSVRSLLRMMPVYLPPRSFTIPVPVSIPVPVAAVAAAAPAAVPAPFPTGRRPLRLRLAPITRALSAVAAILCVVLFSADAMQSGVESMKPLSDASGAMQITASRAPTSTTARSVAETEAAARPASAAAERAIQAPAAAARASDSGAIVSATAVSRGEYPPSAAAAPAAPASAARAAPAAAAPPPAPQQSAPAQEAAPAPQGTVVAFTATQTTLIATPAIGGGVALKPPAAEPAVTVRAVPPTPVGEQAQPAPRADDPGGMTPLRTASFIFAVIAAGLLLASIGLARNERDRGRPHTGGPLSQ